jgi:hypothetical protein
MKLTNLIPILASLVLIIAAQLACQTLLPSSEAVSTSIPTLNGSPTTQVDEPTTNATNPASPSDDEIREGIQHALDLYAQAYNENDPDLLTQVVDQENLPFRRIVKSRFDEFQNSSDAGQFRYEFNLLDIEKREFGYVIAHFEMDGYAVEAEWPFRMVAGNWVLTEPTVEQIGKPVITETEHFVFTTYPWADDVNPRIMEMMETARDNVETVLGKVPDEKANIKILPIYSLSPYNPMGAIALYNREQGAKQNLIDVYAPYSYAFSFFSSTQGWEGELQATLTHEYTHMTHARSFNSAGRLSDWMSEGLAEYVAGASERNTDACYALRSGTLIPIVDQSDVVYKQDLMHMYNLERNFGLSYSFATSLVNFTVENYGGLDGFWKLATALDETSDFTEAVPEAFGISYEDYDKKWQDWLRDQC